MPQLTLDDVLNDAQMEVLLIKRRLFALAEFVDELSRVTRRKGFYIRNDILWMFVIDARDMLVIQFASWAKRQYSPGGLFGTVQAHYLANLRRGRQSHPREAPDLVAILVRNHDAAFRRLFPTALQAVQPDHMDALRSAFAAEVAPVLADRNTNRAHSYENAGKATSEMVSIVAMILKFEYVERVLNDLRLISSGTTMAVDTDLNFISAARAARDLVDLVLVGRAVTDRDAWYDRLHREHDARCGDGLFNEVQA